MEEVVGKYLGNEKIVGDQVLMILYWHVFVKYWVVVTIPIHHYPETVITLQFSVAYYQFLSGLTFAEFISACSVIDFTFSFEISMLNTFNLLATATV